MGNIELEHIHTSLDKAYSPEEVFRHPRRHTGRATRSRQKSVPPGS